MRFSNLRSYPDALPAVAGVLLKGLPMSQTRQAHQLLREARRYARELVRDAADEARDCHQHAARAGYEAGFSEAIVHVLRYLRECRRVHLALRARVEADVRDALLAVLGDPDCVARLSQDLAERRAELQRTPVRVTLPRHARHMTASIRERVATAWPDVEIAHADTDRFIVEWGEEVLEFDPSASAAQLSGPALAAYNEAIAAMDADALARSMLNEALAQLDPGRPGEAGSDLSTLEEEKS